MMQVVGLSSNIVQGLNEKKQKGQIVFKGEDNQCLIGENVELIDVKIYFMSSGGTVEIADNCIVRGDIFVGKSSKVSIGKNSKFNKPCVFRASHRTSISLGEDCLFANAKFDTKESVFIFDRDTKERINPESNIVINNHVWIAENVLVRAGSTIGENTVIGACSVVLNDIPANSIAVGFPARVVKSNVEWRE